jgi:hypothetical protein
MTSQKEKVDENARKKFFSVNNMIKNASSTILITIENKQIRLLYLSLLYSI